MYVLFHSLYCLLTSLYCNIDISTTLLIVKQYKDIKINSQNTNWKKQSKYQLDWTYNVLYTIYKPIHNPYIKHIKLEQTF